MKQILFALIVFVSLGSLASCAHTPTGGVGHTDYSYTSSPSYNNGNMYRAAPSSTAQTTAGKMISPMTGY